MAFLVSKCPKCSDDYAVYDDGSFIPCKCLFSPPPLTKREFKRPQLIEDEANEQP